MEKRAEMGGGGRGGGEGDSVTCHFSSDGMADDIISANSTMFPTIPMDLCCHSLKPTRSRGISSTNPRTFQQALGMLCSVCKANLS